MLSKPKLRIRSERGNLYGFIADWNVLILDRDGRTLKSNIPGDSERSDVAFGDMDRKGNRMDGVFEDDEIERFENAKTMTEKISALGSMFGACASVPEGFIVGNDQPTVIRFVGEWSSRQGRLFPATVPGLDVRLSDGSRELLAMVAFEGHPRMDMAAYFEGVITEMWGHKFRIPDDYLYDGEVVSMRGFADADPDVVKQFVSTYRDDILNYYDTPVGREIVERFG